MRALVVLLVTAALAHAVPSSPKIEILKKAVLQEQSGAVEAFWTEVASSGGTPLIECPKALAPDCLTTFLWRGDASTTNVVIRAEAMPGAPADHMLEHLPGTDVWYRTYRFRNDARFMYMLSINDPLTPWDVEGPERRKRFAGVRVDPLNHYIAQDPRNACYVSLPKAPPERNVKASLAVPCATTS